MPSRPDYRDLIYVQQRIAKGRQPNGFVFSIDWEEKEVTVRFHPNSDGSVDEVDVNFHEFKDKYSPHFGGTWYLEDLENGYWEPLRKELKKL